MEPEDFASALVSELESLPEFKTTPMRAVRQKYSKRLRAEDGQYALEVAQAILDTSRHRWIAYEIIRDHPAAFHTLDRDKLEALGRGMVVKAMSWALRELAIHDPEAVENFLVSYQEVLAARVKREVRNKIETGLKNP